MEQILDPRAQIQRPIRMTKEISIQSRFYKQHPVSKLMDLTLEEIDVLIDEYLENYITKYIKRNPGKDLPSPSQNFNSLRNIRTNVSKDPVIVNMKKGRKNAKQ